MKKRTRNLFLTGIFCVFFLGLAIWQANTLNGGRLVVPMDFSAYTFQLGDLPMLAAIGGLCLYTIALLILLFKYVFMQAAQQQDSHKTRSVNPRLGWLGFMGFFGFFGIWTYQENQMLFPFCFFLFFGFFGFFYEGKMSNTLMDERFQKNSRRAQLNALKCGGIIIWLAFFVSTQWNRPEIIAVALTISIAIASALTIFLSSYLLYRYDNEEESGEA